MDHSLTTGPAFRGRRPPAVALLAGVAAAVLLCGAAAAQVVVTDGATVMNPNPVTSPVTVSGNGWTLVNTGSIDVDGGAVIAGPVAGQTIKILNAAQMSSANFAGAAIEFAGAGDVQINNSGTISQGPGGLSGGQAISFGPGVSAATLRNSGTIATVGGGAAITVAGAAGVEIQNLYITADTFGTIDGGAGGVAIDNSANAERIVVTNQGTIVGAVKFGRGDDLLLIQSPDGSAAPGPVGDVIGQGAGTVRFDTGYVDGAGPVAYAYGGTISNVAQIDVQSGEITFSHAPTQIRDFRIQAGGRAIVNEDFTHAGTLTVTLPSKSDGSTALLQVNGVANLSGATVRLDVADAGAVGRATKIVSATGGLTAPAAGNVVVMQSTLYNVTVTATSTDLIVTPTIKEASTVAGDARAAMPAFAAMLANGANDPAVARIAQAFGGLSTAQQQAALVQLSPNTATTAGAARQGVNTSNQVNGVVAGRQRAAREGAATGMSAGNQPGRWTAWAQGYGGATTQGPRDGFEGFTTSSYGGAVGADMAVAPNVRVGVAANAGHGEIDGAGTRAGDRTKVDNYGVTLYGSLNARAFYVDGSIGGGYNRNDARREIGFLGETASGEFDSWQVNARIEAGAPLAVPRVPGLTVTPSAFAQYTYLDQAGYTESGAGAASLAVDGLTTHAAEVGAGARLSYAVESAFGTFIPEIRLGYVREVGDDRVPLTTTFTGGGPTFVTNGPTVPHDNVSAGTALTLRSTRGFDLTLNYDYLRNVAAEGHSGYVRVRVPF